MSAKPPAAREPAAAAEQALIVGDLSKLTAAERLDYYRQVCESLGLNPLTKPFEYLTLNGRLVLYARRDATDQLRRLHGVSVDEVTSALTQTGNIIRATAKGHDRHGRSDVAIGAVFIGGLTGEALANALMRAETKAKRRLTLSLVGLGWLDETEVPAEAFEVGEGHSPTSGEPETPIEEEATS